MVEITDRESLEAWLEDRPCEDSVLIAARAALRALPLIGIGPAGYEARYRVRLTLLVFRALAVASLVGKWSSLVIGGHSFNAAFSAISAATGVAGHVADAASNAAFAAAPGAGDAAANAVVAATIAVNDLSAVADLTAVANLADVAGMWAAVSSDATALENGASHEERSAVRLWQRTNRDDMAEWVATAWAGLKAHLLAADEGWEVWTGWYEARLEGRFGPQALELARATIPDEEWEQGPAHVNAIIKRQIEEYTAAKFPAAQPLTVSTETARIGLAPSEIAGKDLYEQTCDRVLHGLGQFSPDEISNQYAAARGMVRVLSEVLQNHRRAPLLVHARIVGARKELARLIAVGELPKDDFRLTTLQGDLEDAHLDIEDAVPLVREAVARRARERMRAPDAELLGRMKTATDRLIEASDDDVRVLAEEGSDALDRVEPGQPITDEADKHAIYMVGWMLFRVPRLSHYVPRVVAGAKGIGALHQALIAAKDLALLLYHLFY